VNGENAALMSGEQVVNKVADDGVRFVAQLRHDATNERTAARVPFEINCAVKVSRAVNLRPAMWPARLFRPHLDKAEFLVKLRIAHDLVAERSPPTRDDLNHRLHRRSQFGLTNENYKRQLL